MTLRQGRHGVKMRSRHQAAQQMNPHRPKISTETRRQPFSGTRRILVAMKDV